MESRDALDKRRSALSSAKRALLEERLRARGAHQGARIRPRGTDAAPLSFAQERLWFLHQLDPQSLAYNEAVAMRVVGELDTGALQRAITDVARRHETLRTSFQAIDGQPRQVIAAEPHPEMISPVVDLRTWPESERRKEADRRVHLEVARPFDLAAGPLLRTASFRIADTEHVLVQAMHHIVSDGWSLGLLLHETAALYGGYVTGRPVTLPPLPIQYADFAAWQRSWLRGEVLERELKYWTDNLHGAPEALELVTDWPRPPVPRGRGRRHEVSLSVKVREDLRELGRGHECTLFMTLLAAFAALLGRSSGAEDIVVGSPAAARTRPEIEGLIGFFVNTLVLRIDTAGDPSFLELLRRVRDTSIGAFTHQDLPFERLVEALNPTRSLNRSPLFQVMFVLENFPVPTDALPGAAIEWLPLRTETAKFDMSLILRESPAGLSGSFDYDSDLYDGATIARLADRFVTLVESVVSDPDCPLSRIELLSSRDRALLMEWSGTLSAAASQRPVHRLFEQQAERCPDAIALAHEGDTVTYGELNRRANQVARLLIAAHGVGEDRPVGVLMEQSIDAVVVLLAVMKAGGVYIPIDAAYPAERVAYILHDATPAALVVGARRRDESASFGVPVVALEAASRHAGTNLDVEAGAAQAAYVIYTSGSTGQPKGVVVEHGALADHCRAAADAYGLTSTDRVLQFASLCFDPSLEQICAPLMVGARVVVRPRAMPAPWDFLEQMQAAGVTVMNPPTAWWRYLVHEWSRSGKTLAAGSIRLVIAGGEAMLPEDVRAWLSGPLRSVRLINAYGPTEATIYATMCQVEPGWGERARLPIGRPLPGRRALILDADQRLAPVGVPGELYLGGGGLARGYLGQPALTAARFMPDPFVAGGRLYRTGDVVRHLPDGNIEFIGRTDDQVKIRGFRVELGDVEAALGRHPSVRQAAVVAARQPGGDLRLIAYFVPAADAPPVTAAELRAFLQRHLPAYMLPHTCVPLEALPINAIGKVDRRSLPDPPSTASDDGAVFVAARNETEAQLAAIWCDLLGSPQIGVHDNFFSAGGHSLLAIRAIARARDAFQRELPLRWLFEHPTIAGLAACIDNRTGDPGLPITPPIRRASRDGHLPLSVAQEEFWALEHAAPGTALFNVHAVVRVSGPLDENALAASFARLIGRHEALRTTFPVIDGQPVQRIAPNGPFALDIYDVRDAPRPERDALAAAIVGELRAAPFDLETGPLIRARFIHTDDGVGALALVVHHVVFDAWSLDIVRRDLTAIYGALVEHRTPELPPLAVHYVDYSEWQREVLWGDYLEKLLAHWRRILAGDLPGLRLPADRPRPASRSFVYGRVSAEVPDALCRELHRVGLDNNATLFMAVLAALKALLRVYSGQDDIRVGTMTAGRTRPEIEHVVGLFANTLVLRTEVSGDLSLRQLLHRVRRTSLEAAEHQDLPFEVLLQALSQQPGFDRAQLFQVLFLFETAVRDLGAAAGMSSEAIIDLSSDREVVFSTFDFIVTFTEGPPATLALKYDADIYSAARAGRMLQDLVAIMEQLVADPERRVFELLGAAR